jgi:hypothetical protein
LRIRIVDGHACAAFVVFADVRLIAGERCGRADAHDQFARRIAIVGAGFIAAGQGECGGDEQQGGDGMK